MRRILRFWDALLGVGLAVYAGRYAPPDLFKDVITELVAFFSIQAAAILPALIFAAGILRPEGLTLTEVRAYRRALSVQMNFWIVLLALDFLIVAGLILGKMIGWNLPISLSFLHFSIHCNGARILLALIVLFGLVAIFRMIPFLRGILSLLFLNGEMVEKSLLKQNDETASQKIDTTRPFETPQEFGKITDK